MNWSDQVLFALRAIQPATRGEVCAYLGTEKPTEKKAISRAIAKLRKNGEVVGDEAVPPRYMIIDKDNVVEAKDMMEHQDSVPGVPVTITLDMKKKVLRRLEVIMADDIAEVLYEIRKDLK